MFYQDGHLSVRDLEVQDLELLVKWLSDDAVLEFYEGRDNPFDYDKAKKVFIKPDAEETACIVEYMKKPIGYIQFYQLDEETMLEYGYSREIIYGTDQFIGEAEYWNKGIGTLLVKSMTAFLLEKKRAERVIMDPQARNVRAIRCYEKCGFEKVKLLSSRELHEGVYEDCWLMEYPGRVAEE
ncbi:GNAT family N-acetyltransferase [Pradoshia sp.]